MPDNFIRLVRTGGMQSTQSDSQASSLKFRTDPRTVTIYRPILLSRDNQFFSGCHLLPISKRQDPLHAIGLGTGRMGRGFPGCKRRNGCHGPSFQQTPSCSS